MKDTRVRHRHLLSSVSALPILLFILFTLTGICSARPRTDVIWFKNGDRITCEIIKLEKGYLYVRIEYSEGQIPLDWSKIASVVSPQSFVVANKDGKRYTGTLQNAEEKPASKEFNLSVVQGSTRTQLSGTEVVGIRRTDTSILQNLHGGIDIGLNYSKQQNRIQYNFGSNVAFTRAKWQAAADYESNFSGGGNVSNLRNDVRLTGTRQLMSPRNFAAGLAEFLQSNEQQLDLRTTLGGAFGHIFSNTNHSFVTAYGGAVWNREHYSSEATNPIADTAEAILGTEVNFFRFKTTNILIDARTYPSLTDLGRVRFDLNTSLKFRIAKDLDWKFGYFLNFDSRPPQNLPKSDYGSTSSLGWTF